MSMTVKLETAGKLPAVLQKRWKGREVMVISTSSVYIAKPVTQNEQGTLLKRLKEAGKKITSKDIQSAIRFARS